MRSRVLAALLVMAGILTGWLAAQSGLTLQLQAEERAALPASQVEGALDRTVLPIPEPPIAPITEEDARKAKAPPRFEVKAPKGRRTWSLS